jgi:hypothetical protein
MKLRHESHHRAGSAWQGMTDGGRRGDITYRSATRHRAATPRNGDAHHGLEVSRTSRKARLKR